MMRKGTREVEGKRNRNEGEGSEGTGRNTSRQKGGEASIRRRKSIACCVKGGTGSGGGDKVKGFACDKC